MDGRFTNRPYTGRVYIFPLVSPVVHRRDAEGVKDMDFTHFIVPLLDFKFPECEDPASLPPFHLPIVSP